MKIESLKKLSVALLASGMLVGSGTSDVMAASRGNSGLPPGPGNPIAAVQSQVNQLKSAINALDARIDALEAAAPQANLLWINHLGLMADPVDGLSASQATAPLSGASGLLIKAAGAVTDKGLEVGLQVPPGFKITKVNVCYQVSNALSFISHIALAQLTAPGATTNVLNDTATNNSTSAVCVDSAAATTPVDPAGGPVRLNIGVTFANTTDVIVIRAVGLHLEPL